jgi:hypothetical protein
VRIPFGTALGPLELRVQARSAAGEVESTLVVNVTGGPLFDSGAISAKPGAKTPVRLVTLFRATRTEVLLPDGTRLTCTSADGYTWETTWLAPITPTVLTARVRADDRDLGELPLVVTDP